MCEVILGNSNKRFSGVTSTMLATLPGVSELVEVAVLGGSFVPEGYRVLSFWEFVRICRNPLENGKDRVFHARRNDEMIQALIAKRVFGAKIKILFTSTAQRDHSRFTKWLIAQMDGIISTCEAAASYLENPPEVIIPHGVDTEEFKPADDRKALWESLNHGGEYGIGMFGRVRPSKGTDLLVRAVIPLLKKDPKPTIVIIGETIPKYEAFQKELQAEIDKAGLSERILFLGKLPFPEVKKYFRSVSLVAALSRNEGFGLTVLEAMASGATVVATKAGAWEEILEDSGVGEIVKETEVESVRDSLTMMLSKYESLALMGEKGRQVCLDQYAISLETQKLVEFYQLFVKKDNK